MWYHMVPPGATWYLWVSIKYCEWNTLTLNQTQTLPEFITFTLKMIKTCLASAALLAPKI